MDLDLVITQLRGFVPELQKRVAGAAQFKLLEESANVPTPSAYVIPLDDNPEESLSPNTVRQYLRDSFAVILVLPNTSDERGQGLAAQVEAYRRKLWKALLGWRPTLEYNGITYEGSLPLKLDRARGWWQFEFGAAMEIGQEDGFQQAMLAQLPDFKGVNLNVDFIGPCADPNLKKPGPDGRIEMEVHLPKDGDWST